MTQDLRKPSWVPVILSLISIIASLGILLTSNLRSEGPLIYLGYLMTPILPIVSLAYGRSRDSVNRSNIFYDIGKSQKILKVLSLQAFIGFIFAVAVVWEIASRWSQQ